MQGADVGMVIMVCKRCNLRPQRRNRRRSFVCSGGRALAGKLVGVAGHVRLRTVPDAQPNAGCHPVKTRRIRFFLRYAGASLTPSCSIQRDSRRSISSRRPCPLFAQLFGRCQTATLRLPKTLIPCTWQSGIWPSTTLPSIFHVNPLVVVRPAPRSFARFSPTKALARKLRLVTTIDRSLSQRLNPPPM